MSMSDQQILVSPARAAELLDVNVMTIYELAASGEITKAYIGKQTRNFRIHYDSLVAYAKGLPQDPQPADAAI